MTPETFISTLLHAAPRLHELHLATESYAEHQALGALYEALPGAVDAVAESWMGLEGKRLALPEEEELGGDDAQSCVAALQEFVEDNRDVMGKRSTVQNEIDTVLALIGRARYQLTLA